MKILITGGTGFVGKTLIPFLYDKGLTDLCLVVRNAEKAERMFGHFPLTIIDNTKEDWTDQLIAWNPEVVLHMATCPMHHNDVKSIRSVVETNILFTSLLLEAVSHTQCKVFVNVGTFSEYLHEGDNFYPNNFYSASKTAVRPILQLWQEICGWKWINVIPYSPYGRYNETTKVFDLVYRALYAKDPQPFSEGKQVLDFIHVDDMAEFFYEVFCKLDQFDPEYTQLYLGTGEGHSVLEVAAAFEKVTGKKVNAQWGAFPYRQMDTMHAIAPIEKNPTFLNWRAKLSLEDGIRVYIEDICKNV